MALSLANHVQDFDPGRYLGGRLKGVETEQGSGDFFDGAVILLGDVVVVCDLMHPYRNGFVFDDLVNSSFMGTALVFRHFMRNVIGTHGCLHLAADSQQKVNGLAALVCGTITVLALAIDLDLGLLHCSTPAHWALVFAKHVSSNGRNRIAKRLMDE